MNQIRLTWERFPDSPLVSVEADGMSHAQLRHYAQRVGFVSFADDDGFPQLIATKDQRDELTVILESAGYEIVDDVEVLT